MKNFKFFIKFKKSKNQLENIFYTLKNVLIDFIKKYYFILKSHYLDFLHKIFKGKEEILYLFLKTYKNYIYPILGGIFLTLTLFYIMTLLISQKKSLSKINTDNIFINFLSSKEIDELKTKDRRLPQKPKEIQTPPTTPKLNTQPNTPQKPKLSIPQQSLKLPKSILNKNSFSIFGNDAVHSYGDSEVTPIVRIEPNYPRKAAIIGAEGFVILQFDITAFGTITNISILQSSPPQIFNNSAIRALQKWKYKPKIVNNKPVMQKNLKVRLDFKLEK